MKNEIQKLKERLDRLVENEPIGSQEVLKLSREVDLLIIEYYRK